jgi:uncharacterized repeat protein (TIGR01451 family)
MKHDKNSRLARHAFSFLVLTLLWYMSIEQSLGSDLTLTAGGRVTIDLVSSDASFSNTLSLVSPAGARITTTGCQIEASPELPGLKLVSEKQSQHGCRLELDADAATPGIQPFAAGTVLRFNFCSQEDADANCEHVWSSNPGLNSDNFDHVRTRAIHPVEFPGRIFQLSWEDLPQGGDMDFNDLIATLRIDGDRDGDGLWDDWEQFGIDADGNGTIDLDLPRLLPVDLNDDGDTTDPGERTSPDRKDIFLEIDYMDCDLPGSDCANGDRHNHRPNADAIRAVQQAFRNAPVVNPDGSRGITLHVSVSNAIPHQQFLNIPGGCFQAGPGIGDFDAVKRDPANFGPNNPRRFAFHYLLFTHLQTNRRVPNRLSSGCGEFPGNDFQVSLGGAPNRTGTTMQQAGTLMHELGHNLDLGHGGGDNLNFKPNYLSVMNYWYQFTGIPRIGTGGDIPPTGRLDYSRSRLPALNEASLDERAGVGDGNAAIFFFCPDGTQDSAVGNGPINWNCDRDALDVGIMSNINGDEDNITHQPVISVLPGFNDWSNLLLAFQMTPSFADGMHFFREPLTELDFETYSRNIAPELSISQTASPDPVLTGSNVTYTITVKNRHPEDAQSVTVTDILPSTTTFVSCTATDGGICTGLNNMRVVKFASIPGGATVTIQLVANVNCPVSNGVRISNTATVSSESPDSDLSNNSSSVTVTTSNPPPVITNPSVNIQALKPPNHKMSDITVSYRVTDNCGPIVNRLSVTSDEPVNGTGDGDTSPDWEILDANHVRLRAERSGRGSGRVYTITITSTDSAGNSSSKQVFVNVPHDQGR